MQVLLQEIILEGQIKNEISSNMSPDEICDYLFIAARSVVYDWCLHDDTYDIKEAMHNYLSLLINIFKVS